MSVSPLTPVLILYVSVNSPHILLKLQCLLTDSSNGSWLKAYFRSSDVNQTVHSDLDVINWAAESRSSINFGI